MDQLAFSGKSVGRGPGTARASGQSPDHSVAIKTRWQVQQQTPVEPGWAQNQYMYQNPGRLRNLLCGQKTTRPPRPTPGASDLTRHPPPGEAQNCFAAKQTENGDRHPENARTGAKAPGSGWPVRPAAAPRQADAAMQQLKKSGPCCAYLNFKTSTGTPVHQCYLTATASVIR